MLAKVQSGSVMGIEAYPVIVEVDKIPGINRPHIIVGLPDIAVKESKERIEFAVTNSGFDFPSFNRFIINLAPAHTKKEGPLFDLPIAIGVLISAGHLPQGSVENTLLVGELSLDGKLRPVKGVLPMALMAKRSGIKRMIVPFDNAEEAALLEDVEVIAAEHFTHVMAYLRDPSSTTLFVSSNTGIIRRLNYGDFAEVKGQQFAKRALEIAASGGHNILLVGSPGSGKTMLARRLPSIMPALTREEALEVTTLYSVAGLLPAQHGLILERPFRSPHHTISDAGIVGGGTIPKPGEITLAHRGILFLDELLEFRKTCIEMLRQPLEDGNVTISRANARLTYPARFMLIGTTNPCPCGHYMDHDKKCVCTPDKIKRYWERLSGPILDRIDMYVDVPRLKKDELLNKPNGEPSAVILARVEAARERQRSRFDGNGTITNAGMAPALLQQHCQLDSAAQDLLRTGIERFQLTGRSFDRILRVARTIADLAGHTTIASEHIAEALQYRTLVYKS